MLSNLAGLAVLRYDKNEIARSLAGLREGFMLPIDIFEDTWLYKEGLEKGRAERAAEARAEGLLAGKREAIRLAAGTRFPSMGKLPELEGIHTLDTLDALLITVLQASSDEDIRVAVRDARSRE